MGALFMVRPGMFTTVQDLGRWGFQSRGVPTSGALDWYSHRTANRLVGNDAAAATLEVTLTGPQIRFDETVVFAIAGAEFRVTLDDGPIAMNCAVEAPVGAVLRFGERLRGARAYIAVAGGIDVPDVLGSRSTHVVTNMGGLEGRALRAGDRLKKVSGVSVGTHQSDKHPPIRFLPEGGATLRVIVVEARLAEQVVSQRFLVSTQSDRMGYRLEGASSVDAPAGGLISSAVPTGAIQVPPAGKPILLMNDHATTGGYAVAGTVITADLPVAGQLAPGDWVEFEACSVDLASAELRRLEASIGAR